MERLNLGCGHDVRDGWVNLDRASLPGVDVVHDLESLPLPFSDGQLDEIECRDVLEHVELVPVVRELHRILAPGGRLRIQVPHFTAQQTFYADPTHRRAFSVATFHFFVKDSGLDRDYYFDFHFSQIESARIGFHRTRWQPWNRLIEPLVNLRPKTQYVYETTFLSHLLPALNVRVTLVK